MNIDKFLDRSPSSAAPTREWEVQDVFGDLDGPTNRSEADRAADQAINDQIHASYRLEIENETRYAINKAIDIANKYVDKFGSQNDKKDMLERGRVELPQVAISDRIQRRISLANTPADQLVVRVASSESCRPELESAFYLVRDASNSVTLLNDQLESWSTDDSSYPEMAMIIQNQLDQYTSKLNSLDYQATIARIAGGEAE